MSTMKCSVVSMNDTLFEGEISMLTATGITGELGILPKHIPLVTLLKPGPLKIILDNGEETIVYVSGGILEVQPHEVIVLADSAQRAADLDAKQVELAKREAENLLSDQRSDIDTAAAMTALAESVAQLQTIRKYKNKA